MLTIKNLNVKIKKKKILKNINFTFQKGKIYVLMGPNASGKSTLAMSIMGNPLYEIEKRSKIIFRGKDITFLPTEKRAKRGLFMSFQHPLPLSGINVVQLLKNALSKKNKKQFNFSSFSEKIKEFSHFLQIKESLLERSLNEDFSGGERKKMEVLQAAILSPKLAIFDEIDTGVDIDALKIIANLLEKIKQKETTYILITHYPRILKYLKPDFILVMKKGRIVKSGNLNLAQKIEKHGYKLTQ